MPTNPNHGGLWTDQIWQQIDDGVKTTAMGICVAQKVFYTTPPMPDATSVPADILDPEHLSITEGVMRPFVEISVRFSPLERPGRQRPDGADRVDPWAIRRKKSGPGEGIKFFFRAWWGPCRPASILNWAPRLRVLD